MKMNKKQKKNVLKWVEALRSGEYEQCEHFLHENDQYCCLGVATELHYGKDCWKKEDPTLDIYTSPEGNTEFLDKPAQKKFAIKKLESVIGCDFPHLNDVSRKSFSEIADLIEDAMKEITVKE